MWGLDPQYIGTVGGIFAVFFAALLVWILNENKLREKDSRDREDRYLSMIECYNTALTKLSDTQERLQVSQERLQESQDHLQAEVKALSDWLKTYIGPYLAEMTIWKKG